VFISDRQQPFDYDVLVMDVKTTAVRPLEITNISTYNQNPVYAPNNLRVLFLAGTEENRGSRAIFSLWSVGVDGKGAKQIADSALFTDPANWREK
jgi:hypothetical protein